MPAPLVLLVDDSEAVLAYERAALAGHYTIRTASDGASALDELRVHPPSLVLLDLSMPVMDGDEVLARMKADPAMRRIPVVVVSSEIARGRACLEAGAAAFAPKPVRADELLALVNRVYDDAAAAREKERLCALFVRVDGLEVGLPVHRVRTVVHQPATRPLPGAPVYMNELIELHGEAVCVLDLARRLGVEHSAPRVDRMLVVIDREGQTLALCVDDVDDPEEIDPADVTPADRWGGTDLLVRREALLAIVRTARGPRAVIEPDSLFSARLLRRLPSLVRDAMLAPEGS
jgi:CheY-like chemotaxis protein